MAPPTAERPLQLWSLAGNFRRLRAQPRVRKGQLRSVCYFVACVLTNDCNPMGCASDAQNRSSGRGTLSSPRVLFVMRSRGGMYSEMFVWMGVCLYLSAILLLLHGVIGALPLLQNQLISGAGLFTLSTDCVCRRQQLEILVTIEPRLSIQE